jgi:uncharacterized protein YabE (DUF348 family)
MQSFISYAVSLRHQPKSLFALGLLIVSVAWGVGTGHLPLAPGTRADARVISLYADGKKNIISTNATTVGDALNRAGVVLEANDLVEPKTSTVITDGFFNINVYRAKAITVVDGNKSYHLRSAYSSPRLLAEAAGLNVFPEDSYKTEVMTNFVTQKNIGVKLTIERSIPFTVRVDGTTFSYRSQPGTVEAALASVGVKRGLKDIVSVPVASSLTPHLALSIARVSDIVTSVVEPVTVPAKTIEDATQPVGYTAVQTPGSDGSRVVTYRIHYLDGAEKSRLALKITDEIAPIAKVTVIGTKVRYAGSVEYWRPFVTAAATANGLDPLQMIRIMNCESTGNALASNGNHFGLFQYLRSTWHTAGGTDDNIYDGAVQIKLTAHYMAVHGTGAWECR